MYVFALYVPQPSDLWSSIAVLAVVFLLLCGCACWAKLSVWKSTLAMLIGGGIVLVLLLNSVWNADLGDYGDTAREVSGTDFSDTFFAATYGMDVGWWKISICSGMIVGLLLVFAGKVLSNRRSGSRKDADSTTALPEV